MSEYKNFMCNPDNRMNCDKCPKNRDMSDWQGRLPCGQYNCWVDCHCNPERIEAKYGR